MSKGLIMMTLALTLIGVGVAWAQSDQNPPPAPPPVPAFGPENPVPAVSENPPISAIDQPGLEPHAAPESFLLPGLHFSESVDSNVGNTLGGSSIGSVTRGLGSLTLQKLWKNYDVAMDYIGGVSYYAHSGIGLEQLQQFDMDNRINWKRGQLAIRDSFSYLPEGTFGFGAYGGSGAYNRGLGSRGAGMLGAGAFGGQTNSFSGGGGGASVGLVPTLTNMGLADVVEELTPKSSVTMAGPGGSGMVRRACVFWASASCVARYAAIPNPSATAASTAAAIQGRRRGRGGAAGSAVRSVGPAAIHSSLLFRSRADCQRLSGSFSRHLRSARSRAAGTTSPIDGAGRSMIAAITLAGDEPSKARLPVSSSYSTRPKEKMSLRASISLPVPCACNCSGDM